MVILNNYLLNLSRERILYCVRRMLYCIYFKKIMLTWRSFIVSSTKRVFATSNFPLQATLITRFKFVPQCKYFFSH